jgi:hypothetical protein
VLVVVTLVGRVLLAPAFVHVVVVDAVDVPVVRVIGMALVLEADVTASLAVDVRMFGVHEVLNGFRHPGDPPVSFGLCRAFVMPLRRADGTRHPALMLLQQDISIC